MELQKRTFEEAKAKEEQRKQYILNQMNSAEKRQAILADEKKRSIERKKEQNLAKEAYLKSVIQQQQENQAKKVEDLKNKRFTKEQHLKEVYDQREYDHKLKKEMDLIKREERLENVQRIQRANQFAKQQIEKKIQEDTLKGI